MRQVEEMSCEELVEVVTDYLEGAMSAAQRKRFEAHLDTCEGCRTYLEQMRLTIEATGRLQVEAVPEPAREELLAAFRGWKRDAP